MNFNSALGSDFLEAGAQWLCLCLLLLFQFLLVINVSCLITNTISQREELQGGVKRFVMENAGMLTTRGRQKQKIRKD